MRHGVSSANEYIDLREREPISLRDGGVGPRSGAFILSRFKRPLDAHTRVFALARSECHSRSFASLRFENVMVSLMR